MDELKIGGAARRGFGIMQTKFRVGQAWLLIPHDKAWDGAGMTFYRPEDGNVCFKIDDFGRRKVSRASNTSVSWRSSLPMTITRRMGLATGTHDIPVEDLGGGLYRFTLPPTDTI